MLDAAGADVNAQHVAADVVGPIFADLAVQCGGLGVTVDYGRVAAPVVELVVRGGAGDERGVETDDAGGWGTRAGVVEVLGCGRDPQDVAAVGVERLVGPHSFRQVPHVVVQVSVVGGIGGLGAAQHPLCRRRTEGVLPFIYECGLG